jgi:hypothetical protein
VIGTSNNEVISAVIASFTRQNEDLHKILIQLEYYFRGSLSRDDLWAMAPIERDAHIEFLNGRFKEAGEFMKKQIPVFL